MSDEMLLPSGGNLLLAEDITITTVEGLFKEAPSQVESWVASNSIRHVGEVDVSPGRLTDQTSLDPALLITAPATSPAADWRALWLDKLGARPSCPDASPAQPAITLQAAVVTLKDACKIGDGGMIRPLLMHTWSGLCTEQVFASIGVRAVLSHKWSRYARPFIVTQLVAYLVWLMCFTGFVMLMNFGSTSQDPSAWRGPLYPKIAYALLAVSTLLAVPFALIELLTIATYGMGYFRKQVLADSIDLLIYSLQSGVVYLSLSNALYDEAVGGSVDIDVLIAVQVTLMWAKLPYFFRGFRLGRFSPLDTLETVVWDARYMLMFIVCMMFGFGVGYTTLFQRPDNDDTDFTELFHSLVTVFIISQGLNVNVEAMYESRHGTAAVLFFVVFEFFISIVMFNTLLSLMVGAFDKMKNTGVAEIMMRRAGKETVMPTRSSLRTASERQIILNGSELNGNNDYAASELIDEVDCILGAVGMREALWTPEYLHVLYKQPSTINDTADLATEVRELKEHIGAFEERIVGRLQELTTALDVHRRG